MNVALLGGLAALLFFGRKGSSASPMLTDVPPPVPTGPKVPKPAAAPTKSTVTSAPPPPPPGTMTLIPVPDGTAPSAANTATASQRAAALGLADYLRRGGDPGRKGKASSFVKTAQGAMGMPSKERDGIYGPVTQARGAKLGATMPAPAPTAAAPAPAPKPAAVVQPAPKPAAKPKPAPAPAKPVPAPKPPAAAKPPIPAKRSSKQAALELASYLQRGGDPGSKGRGNPVVRDAQRDMGMPSKEQDGIVGPITRAAAGKLGVTIAAPAKASKPAALKPVAKAKRTPKQAAADLATYVKSKGAQLGNRTRPSQIVHDAQVDMLMSVAQVDGIYGPVTAARGKALGVAMPARP